MTFSGKRVLVVDDDPDLLQLVSVLLARINLDVMIVEHASVAAQQLKSPPVPDLLILDLMLPDVSGMDFLREVRDQAGLSNMPVLVLSALIDPDQIRDALNCGADRYLTKPYIAHNLVTVVSEMLKTGRRRQ